MCRKLVALGANADWLDKNQQTPLYYAIRGGKIETINFLLDSGADVNAEDNKFQTPLSFAKKSNKPQVINLLISRGAKASGLLKSESSSQKSKKGRPPSCAEKGVNPLVAERKVQKNFVLASLIDGQWITLQDWAQFQQQHPKAAEYLNNQEQLLTLKPTLSDTVSFD